MKPIARPNAEGGYDLNHAAMLVVMLEIDLDDLNPGKPREDLARFQERCRGLLAASPPEAELADVLWRHFGPALLADMKAVGWSRALDRMHERCGATS